MQIHELNNYRGALGEDTFIAIDDGNDTGKLSTEALLAGTNEAIAQAEEYLNSRIDNIIGGEAPSAAEVIDGRLAATKLGGYTYPSLGPAIRGQASLIMDDVDLIANEVGAFYIDGCLYKKNKYINESGVEVSEAGYDLYRIPFDGVTAIYFKWDPNEPFYQGLGLRFVFAGIDENEVVTRYPNVGNFDRYDISTTAGEAMFVSYNEQAYLSVCIKADKTHSFTVKKVTPKPDIFFVDQLKTATRIDESNALKCKFYITPTAAPKVAMFPDNEVSFFIPCYQGDRIVVTPITGFNYYGLYVNGTDISSTKITDAYTAPADGFFIALGTTDDPYHATYYPSKSIELEYKHIVNAPLVEGYYDGLNGVAFGTSLTYRSQSTGGYLQYLPDLSGITFENQGIGGAGLLSDNQIYVAVANYANYSAKDVCLLEGFVNDWYHEAALGSYTDAENVASVCGRLRWCINYILSQNPSISLFVILDHYGRSYGGISEASTEVRGGKTQYEYYEELAKVCESLNVPVIKLYAKNRMSENTPQYFIDDIHPNALGAEQTAKTIWAGMKELYPSVQQ